MAEHRPLKPQEMADYLRTISFILSDSGRVHLREIAREIEARDKALELIEYASRKDSLTEHERLQSVRTTVCAELSRIRAVVGTAGSTDK